MDYLNAYRDATQSVNDVSLQQIKANVAYHICSEDPKGVHMVYCSVRKLLEATSSSSSSKAQFLRGGKIKCDKACGVEVARQSFQTKWY
ncbi:hypothetical protein NPIL_343051 [Nephila pilipes]|uniref:Uncharacterized protein n=1 Tax=Nephila pilipes TaxID=299642 RepID=A0A8X6P638_NEPPI|nr:hypothetical protein NPIL_343051 [Nephila pilipes]